MYGVLSKFMPFLFQTCVEKNLCGENLCGEKMTNMRSDKTSIDYELATIYVMPWMDFYA